METGGRISKIPAIRPAGKVYAAFRRRTFQRSMAAGTLLAILILFVLIYLFWGEQTIAFFSDSMRVRMLVSKYPLTSRLIFFFANFLQVVVAVIPGEPFEFAAGFAFGAIEGTLICMAAIYAASILIFLSVKRYGRAVIELFFESEKIDQIRLFQKPGQLNVLMYILMFIPGTPKDILTYLAGLTPMRLSTWLVIISARLLSVVTSTVSGGLLGSQNYLFALVVFGLTAAVALVGILMYRRLDRQARADQKKEKLTQRQGRSQR